MWTWQRPPKVVCVDNKQPVSCHVLWQSIFTLKTYSATPGTHVPDETSISQKWVINLLASRRYKRYLSITDQQTIRIDRKAVRQAAKYDGKWVLETNDDALSVEDAAHGYRGLMVIERYFRSLKRTQIRMMPMYHWLPHRIEAHVKICVLALLIERLAEIRCAKSWS